MNRHRLSYLKTALMAAIATLMFGGTAVALLVLREIHTPMLVWRKAGNPWVFWTVIVLLSALSLVCLAVVFGGILCLRGDAQEAHRRGTRSVGYVRQLDLTPKVK
jgi:hypothetical protein